MKWEYRFMKFKKIHSGLIALGLCCSLLLQTPVFAAEETADTASASAISTNDIAGWPQPALPARGGASSPGCGPR